MLEDEVYEIKDEILLKILNYRNWELTRLVLN